MAITTPHPVTNPELHPSLGPEWIFAHDFETFQFAINDYWAFDGMVLEWNWDHEEGRGGKKQISVFAFPRGQGCRTKYSLRSTPSRERVYTLVDPRLYSWKTSAADPGGDTKPSQRTTGRETKRVSKTYRPLQAKPPRWYLNCDKGVAAYLKKSTSFQTSLLWELKDGLAFPHRRPSTVKLLESLHEP
jgi:hypothetical protein